MGDSAPARFATTTLVVRQVPRDPISGPVEALVAAHLGLSASQVALTNGVDEAIHVLFETFLEAGDELLLPVPTYTMYEVYAAATEANVVTVLAADFHPVNRQITKAVMLDVSHELADVYFCVFLAVAGTLDHFPKQECGDGDQQPEQYGLYS